MVFIILFRSSLVSIKRSKSLIHFNRWLQTPVSLSDSKHEFNLPLLIKFQLVYIDLYRVKHSQHWSLLFVGLFILLFDWFRLKTRIWNRAWKPIKITLTRSDRIFLNVSIKASSLPLSARGTAAATRLRMRNARIWTSYTSSKPGSIVARNSSKLSTCWQLSRRERRHSKAA